MKHALLISTLILVTTVAACSRGAKRPAQASLPAAAAPKSALSTPETGGAGQCADITGYYGCEDEGQGATYDLQYDFYKDDGGVPRLMQSESEAGISFVDVFSAQFLDNGIVADGQVHTEKGQVFGQKVSMTYSVDCKGDDISIHAVSKIEGDMADTSGTRIKLSKQSDGTLRAESVSQDEGGKEVSTKAICTPKEKAQNQSWFDRLFRG